MQAENLGYDEDDYGKNPPQPRINTFFRKSSSKYTLSDLEKEEGTINSVVSEGSSSSSDDYNYEYCNKKRRSMSISSFVIRKDFGKDDDIDVQANNLLRDIDFSRYECLFRPIFWTIVCYCYLCMLSIYLAPVIIIVTTLSY